MPTSRRMLWALAGLLTGAAGLATSYAAALLLTVRQSPVIAVAEWVIALTPGSVVHWAIETLGHLDKPVLIAGILVVLALLFAGLGMLARHQLLLAYVGFLALAAVGTAAVASRPGFSWLDLLPPLVGVVTWMTALPLLTAPLHDPEVPRAPEARTESRRAFLVRAGVVGAMTVVVGVLGRVAGSGRRTVEEARRLLRLDGVTPPPRPRGTAVGLEGVAPWRTPDRDFYLVHTAVAVPTIEPEDWELRIHGMVDREIRLSYRELVAREFTQRWMTLSCVSNPVGGSLIGNAWWSGVPVADLLAEAGVRPDADAVYQTSHDGWTCATPLSALTDGRAAMIAVGMNGEPLPVEHGFPARMIVPGLYGYVSATKWVVDLEVTRFDRVEAYWTTQGWAEQGPVKIASRIDVPRDGSTVDAGAVGVGGVAWHQHTGIDGVEVSLDGGDWQAATLARAPNEDAWVQWAGTVDAGPGDHTLRVRAIGGDGEVQTGKEVDVVPDGATGWHEVTFTAQD